MPSITKETPSQLKRKEYYDDLLKTYDLGEVISCTLAECKERGIIEKPDIVICAYEYEARGIKDVLPDTALYVAESVNSVFSRKAETEEKMEKNRKIFESAASLTQRIRESTEEERMQIKKFHAMSYNDIYKMIQKAITGDDENLRKQAWDLLWGPGEKYKDFIWMRVQLMAEIWEHSKGKTFEELMLMSMERHIDQGTARKMDNFTDESELEYHQYMFLDPLGYDTNHIRRLPFATKDQERYAYENLLEKNEIPTNYLRVQVEANSLRKQYDDYLSGECAKVKRVLEEWKKDPSKSKKELGVVPWNKDDDVNESLTEKELVSLKDFLKKHTNADYKEMFGR